MNTIFKTPAILSKITSMKDRGYRLQLDTQELDPIQVGEISQFLSEFVMLGLAAPEEQRQLDDLEAPEVVIAKDEKSKSQQLRGVLYRLWEYQYTDKYKTFTLFYDNYLEQLIMQAKAKLPER